MFRNPLRATMALGAATYVLLGGLAIFFYLERTVFIDIAFHAFTILKTKTLFIQNQRFVAAFTQGFPLVAQGLHLSLKGVLMAYSVSFVALYGLVFFACTRWLKDWKMGLVLIMVSILIVKDTFYWCQSELPQGMAILVFTFALIRNKSEQIVLGRGWLMGLVFLLWTTVAFAHPMLLFATLFALLFFWEKSSEPTPHHRKIFAAAAIFILGLIFIKNRLFGVVEYDASAMGRVKNFIKLFPHYFDIESNRLFLRWCLTDYWLLTLGFVGVNVVYLTRKNWPKWLLFNAFFFAYLLLVNVSIPNKYHQFYMENLYLPLAFMVALAAVFDGFTVFGQKEGYPRWIFPLLGFFIAIRLLSIGIAHEPWTARLNWEKQFMQEQKGKLIFSENLVPMDTLLLSWGSSYEFMLLSSLQNPKDTRLITIDEEPARLVWAINKARTVITEWEIWDYEALPHRYFDPQDTSFYRIQTEK